NIGVGETVAGVSINVTTATTNGSQILTVPATANVAPGESATATGVLPANTFVTTAATAPGFPQCAAAPMGGLPIVVNPADATTLLVCVNQAAVATVSATVAFSSAPLIAGGTFV